MIWEVEERSRVWESEARKILGAPPSFIKGVKLLGEGPWGREP